MEIPLKVDQERSNSCDAIGHGITDSERERNEKLDEQIAILRKKQEVQEIIRKHRESII